MIQERPTPGRRYRKVALAAAIAWTIAIFVACLWPGKELPHSDIPFIDKWTHFILFGVFSLLWLGALPSRSLGRLAGVAATATALGILVEVLQGALPHLGRSGDVLDAVADAIGGILGVLIFRAVWPLLYGRAG